MDASLRVRLFSRGGVAETLDPGSAFSDCGPDTRSPPSAIPHFSLIPPVLLCFVSRNTVIRGWCSASAARYAVVVGSSFATTLTQHSVVVRFLRLWLTSQLVPGDDPTVLLPAFLR